MDLHLFIYGEIGGDAMFGDAAPSPDEIQTQLNGSSADEVVVHISSGGGGVYQGWTIGNILKNSGKKTVAKIEGFCGSIATYIALSCDRVEMADTARFMIHNPSIDPGSVGEEQLGQAQDQLASIKDDLIRIYREKTGLSSSQLTKMMDEETSLTSQQAKQFGFVDGFMTPIKAVAKFDITNKTMKEEKVDTSALDKIIAKAEDVIKSLLPSPKNVTIELADGSVIFVESEDGELEGKSAFTVVDGTPTDEAVADGTYPLTDGRNVTVEGGIVTSVAESEDGCDCTKELKDAEDVFNEQLATAQKENETLKNQISESKAQLADIVAEVKTLKTLTAGDTTKVTKAHIEPKNKFEAEPEVAHPLDGFASQLKKKR